MQKVNPYKRVEVQQKRNSRCLDRGCRSSRWERCTIVQQGHLVNSICLRYFSIRVMLQFRGGRGEGGGVQDGSECCGGFVEERRVCEGERVCRDAWVGSRGRVRVQRCGQGALSCQETATNAPWFVPFQRVLVAWATSNHSASCLFSPR